MPQYVIYRADEELAHFGTKGMKWGQRRFQNEDGSLTALGRERYGVGGERSAGGTKRDLNKLDREQTNAKARYDYYNNKATRKIAKLDKKINKIEKNNTLDSASDKTFDKLHKLYEKKKNVQNTTAKTAEEYKALLDRSKAMTDKIIKESLAKGYSIHSKDVLRSVNYGHSAAISAIGTIGGMALSTVSPVSMAYVDSEYAPGTHYRVRNDGLGTRTHRSRRFSLEPHIMR